MAHCHYFMLLNRLLFWSFFSIERLSSFNKKHIFFCDTSGVSKRQSQSVIYEAGCPVEASFSKTT